MHPVQISRPPRRRRSSRRVDGEIGEQKSDSKSPPPPRQPRPERLPPRSVADHRGDRRVGGGSGAPLFAAADATAVAEPPDSRNPKHRNLPRLLLYKSARRSGDPPPTDDQEAVRSGEPPERRRKTGRRGAKLEAPLSLSHFGREERVVCLRETSLLSNQINDDGSSNLVPFG